MTVSCEIIFQDLNDALYIENNCIFQDTDKYYVCEKKGSGINKIPVEVIARNNQFTALEGNIKKGQKLLSHIGTHPE